MTDGFAAITSGDPSRLLLLQAVVRRAAKAKEALHDDLAFRIAQRVGELFSE